MGSEDVLSNLNIMIRDLQEFCSIFFYLYTAESNF